MKAWFLFSLDLVQVHHRSLRLLYARLPVRKPQIIPFASITSVCDVCCETYAIQYASIGARPSYLERTAGMPRCRRHRLKARPLIPATMMVMKSLVIEWKCGVMQEWPLQTSFRGCGHPANQPKRASCKHKRTLPLYPNSPQRPHHSLATPQCLPKSYTARKRRSRGSKQASPSSYRRRRMERSPIHE